MTMNSYCEDCDCEMHASEARFSLLCNECAVRRERSLPYNVRTLEHFGAEDMGRGVLDPQMVGELVDNPEAEERYNDSEMDTYVVTVPIILSEGRQTFLVSADGETDAVERWRSGEGKFEGEELEATDLDEELATAQKLE